MQDFLNGERLAVLLGVALAGLVAAFFLLLGFPPEGYAPYLFAIMVTAAAAFLGTAWIGTTRANSPVRGVFVVIGGWIIAAVVLFDFVLTIAWRLPVLAADIHPGVVYAVLVLVNGVALLLISVLPTFSRFAAGLSKSDAAAKGERLGLEEQLREIEDRFFIASAKKGKRFTVEDRLPITLLREKSQFLTPVPADGGGSLRDTDAGIQQQVARVAAIVERGLDLSPDHFAAWLEEVGGVCRETIRAMEKRERLLPVSGASG